MNDNFKCRCCENDEVKLRLIIKETETNEYIINDDGTLKHFDNRDCSQEIKLECPECGMEYEFEEEFLQLEMKPTLTVLKPPCYLTSRNAEKEDLKFK